jgi:hypothetical protein
MFWKRIVVGDKERILVAKNGRFQGIFPAGTYRFFVLPGVSLEIERHDINDLVFRSRWATYLAEERPDIVEQHFTRVETNDVQVAMVYVNSELFSVLTPGRRTLFWRGAADVRAEMVDVIGDEELSGEALEMLEAAAGWPR